MFEELQREIRKLAQPISVAIDLPLDENGYLDRKCPHQECNREFKVVFEDWSVKVSDEFAVCPKCGEKSDPSHFNTTWQADYIEKFAEAYMAQRLNDALTRAARRTRPKKLSAGLFNVEMSVSYKSGPVSIVLPPDAAEVLRQDLSCEDCGCRFSTVGAGYFCPACGLNSPLQDFCRTIEMTRINIEGLASLTATISNLHGLDSAANFELHFLEDQVENLITAFQRATEARFIQLPNAASFKRDANLFQRLNDASSLWLQATGQSYEDILSCASDLSFLRIMICRRHKIGHCQAIVDEKYVQQSGDTAYAVGQRIVTHPEHVDRLAKILDLLLIGLKDLVEGNAQSNRISKGSAQ